MYSLEYYHQLHVHGENVNKIPWLTSHWLLESENKILNVISVFLAIFSPLKGIGPFMYRDLNSLYPRMHCDMFCLNFPFDSGEDVENIKSLPTDDKTEGGTDRQTAGRQQVLRKSSFEISPLTILLQRDSLSF